MSDKLPTISAQEPVTDFTDQDIDQINKYIEEGLPNISTVDESKLSKVLDLYLSGRSYKQCSNISGVNKQIILYLSHKFKWFDLRKSYLEDLGQSVMCRMAEAKIVNQDFLLQLINLWQKKIGNKINKYLVTNDEQYAKEIDLKEVDKYLKTLEILFRISGERNDSPQKPSPIGLNLGDGVTIERKGDNTVEITPKQKAVGEALKQFADMRREQEKKN